MQSDLSTCCSLLQLLLTSRPLFLIFSALDSWSLSFYSDFRLFQNPGKWYAWHSDLLILCLFSLNNFCLFVFSVLFCFNSTWATTGPRHHKKKNHPSSSISLSIFHVYSQLIYCIFPSLKVLWLNQHLHFVFLLILIMSEAYSCYQFPPISCKFMFQPFRVPLTHLSSKSLTLQNFSSGFTHVCLYHFPEMIQLSFAKEKLVTQQWWLHSCQIHGYKSQTWTQ